VKLQTAFAMQQNKITILSTRPLSQTLINEAAAQGVEIDVQSFIETAVIQSEEVQQKVEQALLQSAVVVFTSMNAVEAVAAYRNAAVPNWRIYCMGQTTHDLVKKYFGETSIEAIADNASELAQLLVDAAHASEVIFFCGDQRRDELPDILRSNNIAVIEILVYHTIATPHVINKQYDAVLFYSPSAVASFFSANKPGQQTVLFAIGNTTAGAIKKHTANNIITGDKPGRENLAEKAISYFVNSER